MDKNEYKVKSEQMLELMERRAFSKAANLADSIEWSKVRNISMLSSVSEIYEKNQELEKSYRILNIAYQRSDGSRKIIYRLCTLALKTGNLDEALDFYDDFMEIAPKDPNQYILRYKILRARKAPVKDQIEALENYKQEEYIEEWAYELAKLYDEAGMTGECISECDDIILWFSEGKFVYQAMELKKKYKSLSSAQQEKYDRRFESFQGGGEPLEDFQEKDLIHGKTGQIKPGESTGNIGRKGISPELEKILPFPDKPIGIQEPSKESKKPSLKEKEEAIAVQEEVAESQEEPVVTPEEPHRKIGQTMDLGDALQSLLNEDRTSYIEEEEYILDTASMEEAIGAIEAITDLPLAESYGMTEGMEEDTEPPGGSMSIEEVLQSISESALDPEIQRMIDEIEGHEEPSNSVETPAIEELFQEEKEEGAGKIEPIAKELDDVVQHPVALGESLGLAKGDEEESLDFLEKEPGEIVFHEEFKEHISKESKTAEETLEDKMEAKEETMEDMGEAKEETIEELEEAKEAIEEIKVAEEIEEVVDFFNQEEESLLEEREEIRLEEAEELEESLFEDSAASASKFIQQEFQLQGSYLEEEDERFVKEKKKKKKPSRKSGAPRSTAPLSRKETAKLHATGKTSPLPTGEISNAISMEDTGFVVQGRYDLETQSGKGIRAGLTEEQKKLFSYFVPVRGMSEQLVDVLEQDKNTNRGGTSKTGNLLIIGQKGSGKTVLAVDLVKAIQKQRNVSQGKVAILTGDALNKKKIQDIMNKLYGGALIIEKAGKLNEKTIARLNKALEQDTGELLVVLEEQRKPLDRMLSMNNNFKKKFTFRLEVPVFINDELVTFGQAYAQENGYRIDEMGILALYSKIDAKQREDHAVTVAEVKEMMDAAMDYSQRASAGKLVKRIIGKNTDEADRIILSEKDFTE